MCLHDKGKRIFMKSQDILDSQRSEGGEQRMRVDVNLHEISSGE